MTDIDDAVKDIIERFTLLIRQVIQKNLHTGDGIDLQDVEQEVRLKIWLFLKKGKKVENLPSYIKRVAYSTTIDELRKTMKQAPAKEQNDLKKIFAAGPGQEPVGDFSPERPLDGREARESVTRLVGCLSDNRKKVLELFLEGLSIEEISDALQWDKPRVRHLFYRGLDDLKERSRAGSSAGNGTPEERAVTGVKS